MSSSIKISNLKIWDDRDDDVIIQDLSFEVKKNRCLAIVGESGSGKSMTVKGITGIHKPWIECTGCITFDGENLLELGQESMQKIRGRKIFMIFQDGMTAFDPSCMIRVGLRETLAEKLDLKKEAADHCMISAMNRVMLNNPEEILQKYPHQLSGGMLQRIMIALALALEPELIIADEPTTALDTITQYEVIDQFIKLRKEIGTTMIFISHDLGVVRQIADDVLVMKDGEKVEEGPIEEIFTKPQHQYTQYLVSTRAALGTNFKRIMEETGDVGSEECEKVLSTGRGFIHEAEDDSQECELSNEQGRMPWYHWRKWKWKIDTWKTGSWD